MAGVISTLANRGFAYKPHLINYSKLPAKYRKYDEDGSEGANNQLKTSNPKMIIDIRDKVPLEIINLVRDSLMNVSQYRLTQNNKELRKIDTCGKTGTAQNPHGEPHAWYIGFAPFENPRIAVVALLENAGLGSENSAPIAGQLLSYFFYGDEQTDKISVADSRRTQ